MRILAPSELSGFLRCVLTVPPVIPVLGARGKLPRSKSAVVKTADERHSRQDKDPLWELGTYRMAVRCISVLELSAFCGCISSGTMLLSGAHPRAVPDRITILLLRLISICVCSFLEPRAHAARVYADAKQVCWNKAKL